MDSHRTGAYDLGMTTPSIAETYFSIPELMRVARGSYKRAADVELAAGGFEDLPTASGYLLAYLFNDDEAIPERIEGLGIKKREFRQLVDTLVLRGYLTREFDQADGEESLALTERGRAANEASFKGCSYVDRELERRLSEAEMAGLRRGLAVLGEIKRSLKGPVLRRGLPS
jgi:DNA-binding MarR family transcriptional regulator